MAISTFSELKTAIQSWIVPAVTEAVAADCIALAEAMFNRTLRVRQMEATATALAITSGVAALPSGFLAVRSFRLTSEPYNRIEFLPIDQIEALDPTNTDKPFYYDRVGDELILYPPTTATARLRYRKTLTPLSDAAPANWLLTSHPDAYLFGSLLHADLRDVDSERIALWTQGLSTALDQIASLEMSLNSDTIQMQPMGAVA